MVRPAGELIFVDDRMRDRRQLGFSRVCIKICLGRPLWLEVLVKGPQGPFWQCFVFEGLEGVCLSCGFFHSSGKCCQAGRGVAVAGLRSDNVLWAEELGGDPGVVGPPLGPWLLAIRRRELGWEAAADGRRKEMGSSHPESWASQLELGRAAGDSVRVNSEVGFDSWIQPSKVARWRSSVKIPAGGPVDCGLGTNHFGPFGPLACPGPAGRVPCGSALGPDGVGPLPGWA